MKRYRAPKAKPGQLKAQWGKLKWDSPDLCYAWGEGVHKCDSHLLHNLLAGRQYNPIDDKWEDCFINELKKRGYDITTLSFSVSKKIQPVNSLDPSPAAVFGDSEA